MKIVDDEGLEPGTVEGSVEEPEEVVEEVIEEEPGTEEVVEEKPEEEEPDDLAYLFEVPQPDDNDMQIDDLFEVPSESEDDLSDLIDVTNADVMGETERSQEPQPRRRVVRKIRRTSKRYIPPATLGGMRP